MDAQGIIQAGEIFALVTGVVYVVLEILQKNVMWVLGILTGAACAVSFALQHVWASMGLNLYYVAMSVWGLIQWKKAGTQVQEGEIHLSRLPRKVAAVSSGLFVLGSVVLTQILRATGDAAPLLDSMATVLGIIGTWWLAQSYPQQWMIWIVANGLTTILCLTTGQYWMALLYVVYIGSAIYGWFHWKKCGKYVN